MIQSAGVIPLRITPRGHVRILLIQQLNRVWCFPKGRLEEGETTRQAAARELEEETGLGVAQWLTEDASYVDEWQYWDASRIPTVKRVTLFPALVYGIVTRKRDEVLRCQWCRPHEARMLLTFASLRAAVPFALRRLAASGLLPPPPSPARARHTRARPFPKM